MAITATYYEGSTVGTNTKNIEFNIKKEDSPSIPLPPNIDITVEPEDGHFNMIHGACKRVTFIYDHPLTSNDPLVRKSVINEDFENSKYVSWCGLADKKVMNLLFLMYILYLLTININELFLLC